MGLQIKVSASEKSDASLIRVYDKTFIFSADNPSGWQSSTTAFISNVTAATLTIYKTDTTTLLATTSNPVIIDVFPTLPNIVNTPYEVTAAALGYTDGIIPDGIMRIIYDVTVTVAGTDFVYSASVDKVNIALVCCCVRKLEAAADSCGCDCSNESVKTARNAWTILRGLQRMISDCNKNQKALVTLKSLQQLCRNEKCLSCH